jgi:tetratricopeptide (TPR) repeat protein
MSVVDLHPEGLLDLDANGMLTEAESERLARHLQGCMECRLERQIRADFRSEREPAPEDVYVSRLLSGVLDLGAKVRPPRVRRRPGSRWRRFALFVAAAICSAGAAAATWKQFVAAPEKPRAVPAASLAAGRSPSRSAVGGIAQAAPGTEPMAVVPRTASALPSSLNLPTAVPAPGATPPTWGSRSSDPIPLPVELTSVSRRLASPTKTADSSGRDIDDAEQLFARANDARRAGDRSQAAELYRLLPRRFPLSIEAQESKAVLGKMLLDDGDPGAALRSFDDYLRAAGVLREDVTVDRALALGRLGRLSDETAAWESFLRVYPNSVHAERARRRLRQLGDLCGGAAECAQGRTR